LSDPHRTRCPADAQQKGPTEAASPRIMRNSVELVQQQPRPQQTPSAQQASTNCDGAAAKAAEERIRATRAVKLAAIFMEILRQGVWQSRYQSGAIAPSASTFSPAID
jgi:hypothetical protein